MSAEIHARRVGLEETPVFARVICGVNGSRASYAAASQAATLAGRHADLELLAVTSVEGFGPTEMSELGPERAQQALVRAAELARDAGGRPATTLLHSADATETLLEASASCDLVAIGARGSSRLAEILLGGRATALVHRAHAPVLVARPLAADVSFPGLILVASDGSDCSARAVEIAGEIAARHASRIVHLHVQVHDRETPAEREALARETVRLTELAQTEPVAMTEAGDATETICEVAERLLPGLLIVGSRGLGGVKALGSVSEVVAHRVRCSVLVVRPPVQ